VKWLVVIFLSPLRLRVFAVKSLLMSRFLLIFLTVCLPISLFPQEMLIIQGRVIDATGKQSLPFTQISILGSTIGTVSNEDGFFRLSVQGKHLHDTILISFLGYETKKNPVASFDPGIQEISLTPVAFDLREVEIIALTPQEVLRRALDSIPVNYGVDSVILTAFIRTRKMVNNKLAEYTEAIIDNLKTGYEAYRSKDINIKHQTSNIPYLYQGRVTSDTNLVKILGEVGAHAQCLGCNFVNDIAEFPHGSLLDEKEQNHYVLSMQELIKPEGGKIYRIRFDQDDQTKRMLHQGEILIDSRDFAIIRITYKPSYKAYDTYEKTKFNHTYFLNDMPGWIQEMPMGETTVTYSKRGETWALSTIRKQYRVTYIHPQHRQRLKYGYKNEVVVTDIIRDPEVIRAFKGDKSIGVNQRWDEVVGETDEAFWMNFNYLPIEEKLRDKLDRLDK